MALKALLTLDLDGVTDKQRTDFYEYLKERNLIKIPDIDTAWKCSFNEGTTRESAINTCENIVKTAASKAKITSVKSVVQVGEGNVKEF